jgi:hypothetical protein
MGKEISQVLSAVAYWPFQLIISVVDDFCVLELTLLNLSFIYIRFQRVDIYEYAYIILK